MTYSTDPSEGLTREELWRERDLIDRELELELECNADEIEYVKGSLIWWRAQANKSLDQRHEAARENVRLSYRLMNLTKERMDIERRQRAPHEPIYW